MTLNRLAATLLASALALGGCASKESTPSAPAPALRASAPQNGASAKSIHGLKMKRIDGTETALSSFAGKVLLVVNTASECGYTPQYEGLQALHAKYENRGFAVLGFPSNDFGGQEPGEAQEIATFCKSRYGVTFPMFEKVQTTGPERVELFTILATAKGEPGWNFHKYLIDKHGVPVAAWGSMTKPESQEITAAIETALAAP
ncbi:MAG TPA: glutathione peroxidase [Polyangiales bacterium]|jgi:glutathione peroxidase|nr:glutathione peroxidase [Polyangiales bacterium]